MHFHHLKYARQMPSAPARDEIPLIPASSFRCPDYLVKVARRYPGALVSSVASRAGALALATHALRAGTLATVLALVSIVCLCSSCSIQKTRQPATIASSTVSDDSQIVQAEQAHSINMEVTGKATVKVLLPDDTVPPRHQRFVLELSNGSTVLVAHNIDEAEKVPVDAGKSVVVHGVYIWKETGGVIHWTHHSDSFKHQGGWIEYASKHYQ